MALTRNLRPAVPIRLSDIERTMLEEIAREDGLSMTQAVRGMIRQRHDTLKARKRREGAELKKAQ
jgi:hypothetical protein